MMWKQYSYSLVSTHVAYKCTCTWQFQLLIMALGCSIQWHFADSVDPRSDCTERAV